MYHCGGGGDRRLADATLPGRQVVDEVGQRRGAITPLMRLQDPDYTRVIIVTLAETTPVAEAAELQDDLRRAGIEPFGWVVNATLCGSGTADPVLRARAASQRVQLARIGALVPNVWVLAWRPPPAAGGAGEVAG